jgi:2-phosphosulfolactate phosphatase
MKIETILTPAELPALAQRDLSTTACVVFDVLRATSTFVTALHHGAQAIIPVSEIAEALAFKKAESEKRKAETILLGGERNGVRISADGIDFDLGNSPREYTPEKVRGKTVASTTTNGTRALRACIGAKIILASSFLNLSATAKFLGKAPPEELLLVCAGTGDGVALEDVLAAGALADLLADELPDAAEVARQTFLRMKSNLPEAIACSRNGRRLLGIPELRADVSFCSQRDVFNLVAVMAADGCLRKIL